ncbi:sialidase family protein [Pelagicoccus sp. SDUM812003]|uniref:sialidase family protein n=1 Tax=Pelagicoccus sp. SDUM812003 TaxID=3041267 RepID=UPI00280F3858|nr:sialidase family protein [Pelagicoccus sp. SDUM812003]MDQ8201811.1 sialidase family protein [Pelagicoccus sp. SDUM812003]
MLWKNLFILIKFAIIALAASTYAEPAWRIRQDITEPLNSNAGWAAKANEPLSVVCDLPFRLRLEWETPEHEQAGMPGLILQYRRNGDEDWIEIGAYDFPYPKGEEPRSPRVSVVATSAYSHGQPTRDLLDGSRRPFAGGSGVNLAAAAPVWSRKKGHMEFEWPLVIRRWIDGAETNEAGDRFDFRLAFATGEPVEGAPIASVELAVPAGHVGGTFVETPGRIGPWQARNGDLYFIMEPAESSNLFMMIKSSDGGKSWSEVDGENRPATDDLESVDGRMTNGAIQIVHQVTKAAYRHVFRTSDHPTHPDTWELTDEPIARERSIAQAASLVVRPDGSKVAFYVGETLRYSVCPANGTWGPSQIIDPEAAPFLAGPQATLGADSTIHLAYFGGDGTIWYRKLNGENELSFAQRIASGVGTERDAFGSVLPLVYLPSNDTVVVAYQLADLKLRERRIDSRGEISPAVLITDRAVVREAADSQQPGADLIRFGENVCLLFIDDASGEIFSATDRDGWGEATLRVPNVSGNWIRSSASRTNEGDFIVRYIYDAGSGGGAGMNRYGEFLIESTPTKNEY